MGTAPFITQSRKESACVCPFSLLGPGKRGWKLRLYHRLETNKGRIAVKGTAGSNSTHSINEDERRSFTDHINGVSWPILEERFELMDRFSLLIRILPMSCPSRPRPCSCLTNAEVRPFCRHEHICLSTNIPTGPHAYQHADLQTV